MTKRESMSHALGRLAEFDPPTPQPGDVRHGPDVCPLCVASKAVGHALCPRAAVIDALNAYAFPWRKNRISIEARGPRIYLAGINRKYEPLSEHQDMVVDGRFAGPATLHTERYGYSFKRAAASPLEAADLREIGASIAALIFAPLRRRDLCGP